MDETREDINTTFEIEIGPFLICRINTTHTTEIGICWK